jgi:hypothetical protein
MSEENPVSPAPQQVEHETPEVPPESSNITISPNTDIDWEGNKDYFQTGPRAGTLKPRAGGTRKSGASTTSPSGLDFDSLKSTQSTNPTEAPQVIVDKKKLKEERKIVEAKVAAKFVMRALDLVVGWISGNTYGAEFTDKQANDRNKYRAELEKDWEDYLITLDIPMHPALVCILGSVFYVAPAMETTVGKERVQSFKEKIVAKLAVGFFRKASK